MELVFFYQPFCRFNPWNFLIAGFYGSDHCPVSLELSKEAVEASELKSSV
jgi:hypothetical protein